ncbi:MAG: TetR/AcrR family transcriptional regulator [Novosphingobium sp.]|nr:TetR/AcrR family transcriptional regulator [Novosphingobium sp.]
MNVRSRRSIPDGDQTKVALIEAAEWLFARHGIAGVSLRQIGAAAGSANTNVVGYHFGNKQALIEAIYNFRLPAIDARRGELLEQAEIDGLGNDCLSLLRVIWLPLFEQKSVENQHTYARFLASISREGLGETRNLLDPLYPSTGKVAKRLGMILAHETPAIANMRVRMQAFMLCGALEYIDQTCPEDDAAAERIFEEALVMCARALGGSTP